MREAIIHRHTTAHGHTQSQSSHHKPVAPLRFSPIHPHSLSAQQISQTGWKGGRAHTHARCSLRPPALILRYSLCIFNLIDKAEQRLHLVRPCICTLSRPVPTQPIPSPRRQTTTIVKSAFYPPACLPPACLYRRGTSPTPPTQSASRPIK
ncbi:uncharacterized protein EI97DRAFT_46372 [Westerdykella ornata]|uniref:Uncharacterized protein n=1 Tax=Westerdykella ornata TaxID=318751 RepID=A0A6A6JK10_WESOR|nr:uncharacterized protein EI97DRAFT_46372 [Westerdykella ornata]KAF2276036.1 hypothetical protein EI97DRAFT_46372 [Westerdykella ornata]